MQGCLSDFIIYIIYLGVYYPLHTLWEAYEEEEAVTSPGYKIQVIVSPTTSCLALLNSQYISCLNIMTQTEKYPHLPSEKMG